MLVAGNLATVMVLAAVPVTPVAETRLFGGAGDNGAHAIREAPGGGYLVAGTITRPGLGRQFALLKVDHALEPDPAFGKDGWVILGGEGDEQALDVVACLDENGSPDGWLAVGYTNRPESGWNAHPRGKADIVAVRMDNHGGMDPRFGKAGIALYGGSNDDEVLVHLNNYSEPGNRLLFTDRGVLVAGMTRSSDGDFTGTGVVGVAAGRDAVVFRILPDGSIDREFGTHGVLRLGAEPGPEATHRAPNEFIFSLRGIGDDFVASGYTLGIAFPLPGGSVAVRGNNSRADEAMSDDVAEHKMDGLLIRFDRQGKLVDDWGERGLIPYGGSYQEKAYDVAVASDGSVFTVGRTASFDGDMSRPGEFSGEWDGFVIGFDDKGHRKTSFGSGGIVAFSGSEGAQARLVRVIAGGEVLVLGHTSSRDGAFSGHNSTPGILNTFIARISSSGERVRMTLIATPGDDRINSCVLTPGGELILAGMRNPDATDAKEDLADGRKLILMRLPVGSF